MTANYQSGEFWFVGKHDGLACARYTRYDATIQASCEADKATPTQFKRALDRELGGSFTVSRSRTGYLYAERRI